MGYRLTLITCNVNILTCYDIPLMREIEIASFPLTVTVPIVVAVDNPFPLLI